MTAHDLGLLLGPPGLQLLGAVMVGLGLLWLYRWIRSRSPVAAGIFAAGLLMRAGLGVALFWISWLDLPLLRSMHLGNGYWSLAPDAMNYMNSAARAAVEGLDVIRQGEASPRYVATVALWMRVVGISPMSGMYLNLALYGVLCASLVAIWKPKRDWNADVPLFVLLAAFSFSPVQIIHGSQSLKDDVFAFVIAAGAVGAAFILVPTVYGARAVTSYWALAAGLGAWLGAISYAAGIRTYFAFFMLCSLAAILGVCALRPRWDTLYRRVPVAIAVTLLSTWVYLGSAGPYDAYLSRVLALFEPGVADTRDMGLVALVVERIDIARGGFARTGGGTNVVAIRDDSAPVVVAAAGPAPEAVTGLSGPSGDARRQRQRAVTQQAAPATLVGYLAGLGVGLATLFVPISLLQALSITNLTGGRGLLVVTDIDTLFVDATILASLLLLYLRRDAAKRRLPFVGYLMLLGGTTAILLAYVVTNFGTQFRLRLLAVVPFWLLLLATAESPIIPAAPEGARASTPAPPDTAG